MAKRPNILILVLDEMRGDVATNPVVRIPNMRKIAEGGISFTNCFTPNPVCVPSRCCTFTGQYPHGAGHRSLYQMLQPHEDNLFRRLKGSGYEVVWVGRNDLFTTEAIQASVSQRHCSYVDHLAHAVSQAGEQGGDFLQALGRHIKLNPFPEDHPHRKSFCYGERSQELADRDLDHQIVLECEEYLDSYAGSDRERPFCLYACFIFPHPPYTVEEPYFSMYDRQSLPLMPGADGKMNYDDKPAFMRLLHERYGLDELQDDDFREILAVYYGMISRLDDQVGRIMGKLTAIGEDQNTAVVLLSDHGDYAGSYGLVEKWPTGMHDCLLKVPLFMRIPGVRPDRNHCDFLSQTIDLFPTLLEVAGCRAPRTHHGRSLLPVLRGEVNSFREAVYAEGGYDAREPQCHEDRVASTEDPVMGIYYEKIKLANDRPELVCRTAMIRTTEWKLVIRSHPEVTDELYDLVHDPDERVNLIGRAEHAETESSLRERLLLWYLETSDNPHPDHLRDP
jgi:choline-sulfatase